MLHTGPLKTKWPSREEHSSSQTLRVPSPAGPGPRTLAPPQEVAGDFPECQGPSTCSGDKTSSVAKAPWPLASIFSVSTELLPGNQGDIGDVTRDYREQDQRWTLPQVTLRGVPLTIGTRRNTKGICFTPKKSSRERHRCSGSLERLMNLLSTPD